MKILLLKTKKNAFHFIKCEDNKKGKKKLGSYSVYQKDTYIRLNFRKLYYYLLGGAKVEINKTFYLKLGWFDLFECFYLYEKGKSTNFSNLQRKGKKEI